MTRQMRLLGDVPRIAVTHCGQGDPVLFLHGVGGNHTNWDAQIDVIGRTHHALAWDMRGYGESDDSAPFTMPDLVTDVTRTLDAFGAQAAHLVGLSLGALIALSFYFACPRRVKSLFLANSAAGLDADPGRAEEFLARRLQPLRQGKTPADIARDVATLLCGRSATPVMRARLEDSMRALRTDGYTSALGVVARFALPGDLARITVPVHYVAGTDDRVVPAAVAARAAARIPGCGYTLIKRAGHLSNIEAPQTFNQSLLDFLHAQT